jgi:hypothetical protein
VLSGDAVSDTGLICIERTVNGYVFSLEVNGREIYCDNYECVSLRACKKRAKSKAKILRNDISWMLPNAKDHPASEAGSGASSC